MKKGNKFGTIAVLTWLIIIILMGMLNYYKNDIFYDETNNFIGGIIMCVMVWIPSLGIASAFDN